MARSGPDLVIRRFSSEDHAEVFAAYAQAVSEGGAFPRQPPADEPMFREAWLERATAVFVAYETGRFAGSYFLRPAFPGLAAHIANAGYVVVPELRGRGIGQRLVRDSLEQARALGFDAMMSTSCRNLTRAAGSMSGWDSSSSAAFPTPSTARRR